MKNLQELIDSKTNLVDYFYNDVISQFHKSRTSLFASLIPPEYSNWREEQRASRETAVLFNQSHHMPVLYVKGPDARKLLNYLSPCTFSNLSNSRAKQYIAATPRGHHVGDCIMYYHGEDEGFELISGMYLLNWVRYHGETGRYDVEMQFDATTPYNPTGKRTKYRFQVQGPNAGKILEEVCEGGWPEIKFFHTASVKIAGCKVQVLRHSMGGYGAELSGPYEELDKVRNTILEIGEKYGILPAGTRSYFTTSIEDGWIAYPFPGIYTGEELRPYREWLPIDSWEANVQLGGSFYSDNIEDYYSTPWSLGYERLVKFDHDFIGREALEESMKRPHHTKRALLWNKEDVMKVFESQFNDNGDPYKSIELPLSTFGFPHVDEVRSKDGKLIGQSRNCGYNINERAMVSLTTIDEKFAEIGTEVVVTWGEVNGGSRKAHVERHAQTQIRAIVSPVPYSKFVRERLRAAL